MTKFYLPLLGLCLTLLMACSNGDNNQSNTEEKSDDMAQFTDDQSFKDAHEDPKDASVKNLGEMIEFEVADGNMGKAYAIISPEETTKFLFVFHEWWGLNDNIKEEAERLSQELSNVTVMAIDLYDGQVTADRNEAGKIMSGVKEDRAKAIIDGALAFAGPEAEIATVGWCFGGGWSLKASILLEERGIGCVMYYGMPVREKEQLAPLQADVLGLFAEKDGFITPAVVEEFQGAAKEAGKEVEVHQFDADHAFANPSSPRYAQEAAQKANALALNFLKDKLGQSAN